jgi:tRNA pseudouridine55 synthase
MDGMLVIDKPAGVTSSKMLAPLRRRFRKKTRVGHTGTLDPFATGVLLVLLGDATRLADLAVSLPKLYDTTIRFGVETTTLDPDGEVVESADPGTDPPSRLPETLGSFEGEILQTPPDFSAVKISGEPAYRLARRGERPNVKPRRVTVHGIEVLGIRWPDLDLAIRCGPGMYVRSLARDIGRELGIPASLHRLRRTAVGPFHVGEAFSFPPDEDLDEERLSASLRPPLELSAAAGLAPVRLPRTGATAVAHGNPVPAPRDLAVGAGLEIAVTAEDPASGEEFLLAIATVDPTRRIRPRIVLAGARERLVRSGALP